MAQFLETDLQILLALKQEKDGFLPHECAFDGELPDYKFPYGDPGLVRQVQNRIMRVNGHLELTSAVLAVPESDAIMDLLGQERFEEIYRRIGELANPHTSFQNNKNNRMRWETAFTLGRDLQTEYQALIADQCSDESPRLGFMIPSGVHFVREDTPNRDYYQTSGRLSLGKKEMPFNLWTPPNESDAIARDPYRIDGVLIPPGSEKAHALVRPW